MKRHVRPNRVRRAAAANVLAGNPTIYGVELRLAPGDIIIDGHGKPLVVADSTFTGFAGTFT